jgi:hypothetical protein
VRTDVGREPAAMTDDGELHLRAQVMASRHTLVTVHAAPRGPADADALSDRETLGIRTDGRDPTDDLMAENRRVLRNAPVIVQDGEIGVTQPAVFDRDFHVLDPERSEINGFQHHRLFHRLRDPGLRIDRVSSSDTRVGLGGGGRSRLFLLQFARWLGAGLGWSGYGYSFLRVSVCVWNSHLPALGPGAQGCLLHMKTCLLLRSDRTRCAVTARACSCGPKGISHPFSFLVEHYFVGLVCKATVTPTSSYSEGPPSETLQFSDHRSEEVHTRDLFHRRSQTSSLADDRLNRVPLAQD